MECHSTFEGLHHWVTHSFTHLGWMVLAHEHKNKEKIDVYKQSLKQLSECIDRKMNETQDSDRKSDLNALQKNVKTLIKYSNKLFRK